MNDKDGSAKDKEEILEKTAKEYFCSAEEEFVKERDNSAVVLFFKALVALIDIFILQNTGKTPSSHNSRFKITKEKFLEIYNILDKDFLFYQDIATDLNSSSDCQLVYSGE